MNRLGFRPLFGLLLAIAMAAAALAAAERAAARSADVYAEAVANPDRPAADRERDAGRKPAAVLEFFAIGPGDNVLEMFAGGGYYTELLSRVVGEDGAVTAQMNQALLGFSRDEFEARHANNRLPNVEVLWAENNELDLGADRFDAITIILNYHDLYWESEKYGWARFDVPAFLAEIHAALKPGGVLGIVDHDAAAGSTRDAGGAQHRLARQHVVDDLEAAGFVLEAESDILRNPDDDHATSVFDPAIRGMTDRYVLRFRKPAAAD